MEIELDKDKLEQMSDEEIGQHMRYIMGESEHVPNDVESDDDKGDDTPDTQGIEKHDDWPVDAETGLPQRLKISDIDKMDDNKLGKMMREWIKYRLSRKGIDLVVFGKDGADVTDVTTGEQDISTDQEVPLEFANKVKADQETYTLKDVAIFATGEYKDREWTMKDLKAIFSNFGKFKGQITPPLKLGHGDQPKGVDTKADKKKEKVEQPAAGWVSALRLKGSNLYADITDIPKTVFDLFVKKAYKRISAEIYTNFKDGKGNTHGPALAAVTVLGSSPPAVKSLPEINARYAELAEVNEVVAFEFDLDQELELAYVADESANTEEGENPMADEKVVDEVVEDVEEGKTEEVVVEEDPEASSESTVLDEDIKKQLAANATTIQKLSTENDAFRKRVQQLEQDNQTEKTLRRHNEEKAFVEKLKENGKILPANEGRIYAMFDALVDIEAPVKLKETDTEGKETESEKTAYDTYREQLEALPAAVDFDEHGKGTKIVAPGQKPILKASSGEPQLKQHEAWKGDDLHARIEQFRKDQPEEVKKYAEANNVSEYEAAMDLVQG